MSMEVPWPSVYTQWMKRLSFANFDAMAMFGVTCLPGMSYEYKFMAAIFMIVSIVLVIFIQYTCKAAALNKSLKNITEAQMKHAANHVFDTVDIDESGLLDPEEYQICLDHITPSKNIHLDEVEIKQQMMAIGAKIPKGSYTPELDRETFIKAVLSHQIGGRDSSEWIKYLERDKLKSKYVSVAVQIMLLLHAPASKKALWFFNAQHLYGTNPKDPTDEKYRRSFLKVDYSMEILQPRWNIFLAFVAVTMVVYVIALPLYIFIALCRSRKNLWRPKELTKYGFLYARFQPGAEMWELHELTRKLLLCGVVGFLPTTTRAALAILICVIAVACLNYFRPPRNKVIFLVAQTAFISTTFKYLGAVLLQTSQDDNTTQGKEDVELLGWLLVFLDMFVMLGGLCAAIFIVFNLGNKARKMKKAVHVTPVTKLQSSLKSVDYFKTDTASEKAQNAASGSSATPVTDTYGPGNPPQKKDRPELGAQELKSWGAMESESLATEKNKKKSSRLPKPAAASVVVPKATREATSVVVPKAASVVVPKAASVVVPKRTPRRTPSKTSVDEKNKLM